MGWGTLIAHGAQCWVCRKGGLLFFEGKQCFKGFALYLPPCLGAVCHLVKITTRVDHFAEGLHLEHKTMCDTRVFIDLDHCRSIVRAKCSGIVKGSSSGSRCWEFGTLIALAGEGFGNLSTLRTGRGKNTLHY